MQNSIKREKNISNSMRLFAFIFAILILSFVLVSSSLVSEHKCTGDHCVICLFTSRISISLAALIIIYFVLTFTLSTRLLKKHLTRRETLITLKEKRSI